MRKIICVIIGLLLTMGTQAQSLWDRSKPNDHVGYRIFAGMNVASTDGNYATAVRTGYHIGGMVDYNIIKSLSLCSGLSFTTKGFHSMRGEAEMMYLQVPVLASYRMETPTGVRFHLNVGPYFSYGFGGNMKFEPLDVNIYYSFDQKSFGDKGFFNHFDIGLSAGAYILLGHVLFGISYEYGLADIAKVYGKFHNRNVAVTLGYNL